MGDMGYMYDIYPLTLNSVRGSEPLRWQHVLQLPASKNKKEKFKSNLFPLQCLTLMQVKK